ncbi:phytanoyl-CoA dioxygenase family protein [Microlunatus panaciterrae]|uniref:Ectoine hydroxylase-related dioxygenase (Phytanoyl-CoA dioxygenase family) n=1 Tax=Microlunatus panaciterrae TaxID=400768 RepID=A0ABS2RFS1_9ACTN|nr:phytanoyl-CoA dioxygenase family protein [Microlunatus panaciterrae]MBM7797841.1 ectoine hydroxylase-related dioxygenase (phytanoyl-CoA dioxygenase family) [Microlunatus panaciterrae]
MTTTSVPTITLTPEQVDSYRTNGFLHVPQVLSPEEVETYREAAAVAYDQLTSLDPSNTMFRQIVQVWKSDPTLRELVLHNGLAAIATQLAGIPLRLWHDQLLIKKPHNQTPTEFHQDAPYWPHANARHQLSAWIALVDVPVERGCMTFIPGSHKRTDLRAIDLTDSRDLFTVAPDLVYEPRVTVPLRAGDCTFHNGYLAHTANSNDTDEFRYALVNIYVDAAATYNGKKHVCTDPFDLEVGRPLPDDEFPPLPR